MYRAPSTTACIRGRQHTTHRPSTTTPRDHHHRPHTMPYSTRRSHHQHTPGRAHSVHSNSANHDAACSVLLCCAQPSVPTRPGERKQWVLPYVYGGTRASLTRAQPPSKGSLRGSKCTPLCNSQLPACKPIVCRRSQVSKSYIDAEQRHQRSSILDTCCMTPRARALSACMQ